MANLRLGRCLVAYLASVSAAAVVGYAASLFLNSDHSSASLPQAEELRFLFATAHSSPFEDPDIEPFPLSKEAFSSFLDKLHPGVPYNDVMPREKIGSAWLLTCDHRSITVGWFFFGKGPLIYTLDGVPFVCQGEAATDWIGSSDMDSFIRKQYKSAK